MKFVNSLSTVLIAGIAILSAPLVSWSATIVGSSNTNNCFPFGCSVEGGEYQQIYSSAAFPDSISIKSLTFYNTVSFTGASALASGSFNLYLSTTTAAVGALSTNLASNIGGDQILVYSGTLPGSSPSPICAEAPFNAPQGNCQFVQFNFILSKNFDYDPADGNLLLTVISPEWSSSGPILYLDAVFAYSSPLTSRQYGGNYDGNLSTGLVTGFNAIAPVPLPAAAWLFLSGLGMLGIFARPKI